MSYKFKLLLYFTLLFTAFALLLIGFQWQWERKFRRSSLETRMEVYADMTAALYDSPTDNLSNDFRRVQEMLPSDLRVTLIDHTGKVVFEHSSDHHLPRLNNHRQRPEVMLSETEGAGSDIRRSATTQRDYFYYAKRYPEGIVRVALPYNYTTQSLLRTDSALLWFVILLLPFALVAIIYTSDRFSKSVESLQFFVDSAERGLVDYDHIRFPRNELGDLGQKIVDTYRRAEENRQAAEREREKKRIFKQQMSNNITHELRTPVAAIQGYLETLVTASTMTDEQRSFFLSRAFLQSQRLSALIRDVALISKMEEAAELIPRELLNLYDVFEEAATDLEKIVQEKQVVLENRLPDEAEIQGNYSLIYAIFRNLIENSAHHAAPCRCILEQTAATDTHLFFRFSDTGSGVPPQHLPHLFERFYRTDEGRTRSSASSSSSYDNGSGLGLSIVRNAILFHGGSITAENRPEGGLSFNFSLQRG